MATTKEKPSIELHLADPKKLESVVAFMERLSGEKLTPQEIEELRRTSLGNQDLTGLRDQLIEARVRIDRLIDDQPPPSSD